MPSHMKFWLPTTVSLFVLISLALLAIETAQAEENKTPSPEVTGTAEAQQTTPTVKEVDPSGIAGEPPKFPLSCESFKRVLDSYDEQEEAMLVNADAMEDILVALRGSSSKYLQANIDKEATYRKLMKEPESFRGHVVELIGVLQKVDEQQGVMSKKIGQNKSGLTRLWQGVTSNTQGQIVSFLSVEPLSPDIQAGKAVRLVGVFQQRFAYVNRQPGDKLTWSPLLFVRTLERYVEIEQTTSGSNLMNNPAGIVIFILVTICSIAYYYSRVKGKAIQGNYFTQKKMERSGDEDRLFPRSSNKAKPYVTAPKTKPLSKAKSDEKPKEEQSPDASKSDPS
jgi:hypothetical protein